MLNRRSTRHVLVMLFLLQGCIHDPGTELEFEEGPQFPTITATSDSEASPIVAPAIGMGSGLFNPEHPNGEPPIPTTPSPDSDSVMDRLGETTGRGAHMAGCEPELSWEHRSPNTHFGNLFSDVAEDNHVVLIREPSVTHDEEHIAPKNLALSIETGQPVFEFADTWFAGSTDGRWQVRARIDRTHQGPQLVFEPVLEAPEFWRSELSPELHHMFSVVSHDSARVVVLSCDARDSIVSTYSGHTGRRELNLKLPVRCPLGLPGAHHQLVLSQDGLNLAFVVSHTAEVVIVNLSEGHHFTINVQDDVDASEEGEERIRSFSPIAGMAMSPDGQHLAVVGGSGSVRLWDVQTMEEHLTLGDSGLFHMNQRSYMPSTEAPLAFSHNGELLAFFNDDEDIEIVSVASGDTVSILEGSDFSFGEEGRDSMGNFGSEAFKLEFLGDDSGLLVSYIAGAALWRCASAMNRGGRSDLPVHLGGPVTLTVGEPGQFTATHLGHVAIHGHAFLVDGVLVEAASTGRHLSWTPEVAGLHIIEVEVRDGLNTGRALLEVQVRDE